jgi:cell cycle checkpoint protein
MWVEKYSPKSSADLCVAPRKVQEIKAWIEQASNQNSYAMKKLLVLVGSPGVGKSTCIRVLAQELGHSVTSWNEAFSPREYPANTMFGVEQSSALDSFQEFLQQSGCGFSSLNISSHKDNDVYLYSRSLILLEELPNLHGPDAERKFRTIMRDHLQRSQVPTILIFSDVSEGKHNPEDLERFIDPQDLYDNARTSILLIHTVTKPKMKKLLTTIAKHQRLSLSSTYMEELHSHCHGDLRNAIMTLQLHASGSIIFPSTASLSQGNTNNRDEKLSTFHGLGKLLYGKKTMQDGGVLKLAFDPDSILERSDMGLEGSLKFLEFHSLDFFTSIFDISKAYEYFSDSIELLDRSAASSSGDVRGCAAAISGRAVAIANQYPTANKFRQFSRPKVFDVIRSGKQNEILLQQLSRRLSTHHDGPSSSSTGGDMGIFVTQSLPFVRCILPQEVDPLVDNLYSAAMSRYQSSSKHRMLVTEEDRSLKEQEVILGEDDIEGFESDY